MRSFVDRLRAAERDGILFVSLGHGFPWGDVADVGAKVIAIADRDRDRDRATRCATEATLTVSQSPRTSPLRPRGGTGSARRSQ
jgi:microcystin degradation protein MlrC